MGSDISSQEFSTRFFRDQHIQFVQQLERKKDSFEYHVSEHLRMSGVYWGLMAMDLIKALDLMPKDKIISFVMSCYIPDIGGFSGNVDHDPHMLYTLSAIQILAIFDKLELVNADKVASYIAGLQQADGSFIGDKWGEVDTRFSYCALNALSILGKLDRVDVKKATDYIALCRNFDGGFGTVPGAESHSGQIFCCVAALAIGNALHHVDANVLGWWLAERQLPCGGLNGRPEKKEDVCYSWWVLTALSIMGKISWIDRNKLGDFIMSCQDSKSGGLSDRPGDMADVFHTYFGIAGLSLLGYPDLNQIDPVYALPTLVVKRLGLKTLYSTK